MKLSELLLGTDEYIVRTVGSTDIEISGLCYNSKTAQPSNLFFCIEGLGADRHLYAAAAAEQGCVAVVLRRDVELPDGIVKIFTNEARAVMAIMSSNFYGNPEKKLKLIGVTGTNGKTSITYFVKAVLEESGKKIGLIGTILNFIGDMRITSKHTTPESVELFELLAEMVKAGMEYVVMEISSHSLALNRVFGIEFEIGIFTNLTQDHLDFHGTLEEYKNAKAKLFEQSKYRIFNADDDTGREYKKRFPKNSCTYGISNSADYYARDIEVYDKGVKFNCKLDEGKLEADLRIPGIFSVYNALAASVAALKLGMSVESIRNGLGHVTVPGRFESLDTGTDYTVILDYAHTPDGLENILQTANEFAKGRIITLFGCGGDRDNTKRSLMGFMSGKYSDFCIVTSDNPRSEEVRDIINMIIPGIEKTGCEFVVIENRREAISYALQIARKDDVVILAGKGHETYQILKDRTIHFDEKEIVAELLGKQA